VYKTIFDLSTDDPYGQTFPVVLGVFLFFLALLLLWIRFRYVVIKPNSVVFINHVPRPDLDERTANFYRSVIRIGIALLIGFITLLLGFIMVCAYATEHRYVQALQNHTALTVEGPIEQFEIYPTSREKVPGSDKDNKAESFYVNDVLFVYSQNYSDGGFQGDPQTSRALAEAKYARVSYLDNPEPRLASKRIILKIEVR
jgi:hypothetical protein